VVSNEHHLADLTKSHHAFEFFGLGSFVNDDSLESVVLDFPKPLGLAVHACTNDDGGCVQQDILKSFFSIHKSFELFRRKVPNSVCVQTKQGELRVDCLLALSNSISVTGYLKNRAEGGNLENVFFFRLQVLHFLETKDSLDWQVPLFIDVP